MGKIPGIAGLESISAAVASLQGQRRASAGALISVLEHQRVGGARRSEDTEMEEFIRALYEYNISYRSELIA